MVAGSNPALLKLKMNVSTKKSGIGRKNSKTHRPLLGRGTFGAHLKHLNVDHLQVLLIEVARNKK